MMHELPDIRTGGNAARRQWALVVIGAWLMGSICTSVVATENFYAIDRLLAGSPNSHFTSWHAALLGAARGIHVARDVQAGDWRRRGVVDREVVFPRRTRTTRPYVVSGFSRTVVVRVVRL
jgi:hypothetical protein